MDSLVVLVTGNQSWVSVHFYWTPEREWGMTDGLTRIIRSGKPAPAIWEGRVSLQSTVLKLQSEVIYLELNVSLLLRLCLLVVVGGLSVVYNSPQSQVSLSTISARAGDHQRN